MPVAFILGVDWSECHSVGTLLGIKTVANEFIAYRRLGLLIESGGLSARASTIATYALCGFANPGSVGVQLATLTSLCPQRKAEVASVMGRAFVAGTVASFFTAGIAGALLDSPWTSKMIHAPSVLFNFNKVDLVSVKWSSVWLLQLLERFLPWPWLLSRAERDNVTFRWPFSQWVFLALGERGASGYTKISSTQQVMPFFSAADSRLTAFFRQEPEGNDINKYDHHHFDEDTLKEVLCSVDLCWKTWLRTWNVGKVALWPSTSLSLLRFFLSIFNELVRWLFPYFFSSSGGSE